MILGFPENSREFQFLTPEFGNTTWVDIALRGVTGSWGCEAPHWVITIALNSGRKKMSVEISATNLRLQWILFFFLLI
jgi:hypothetical protein